MTLLIDLDIVVYRALYGGKDDFISTVEVAEDNILLPIIERFDNHDKRSFLTGGGNFRDKIATIKPYKGNRDRSNRPRHYSAIREYFIDFWEAEVVNGMEADDAIGISQDDNSIICTIDKDLDMVPGQHYNINDRGLYYISPEEGVYNFLRQMLVGDAVDNIPGIDKIGKVKSERLLINKQPKEQLEVVEELYKKQYGQQWRSAFDEIATLLWIRQKGAFTYKDCKLLYQ